MYNTWCLFINIRVQGCHINKASFRQDGSIYLTLYIIHMKHNIKHLAAYFPYNVKAKFKESNTRGCRKYTTGTIGAIHSDCSIVCYDTVNSCPDKYKLLLWPLVGCLLDDEFINEFSNIEFQRFCNSFFCAPRPITYLDSLNCTQLQVLLKKHYDVFGLIDLGLAEQISLFIGYSDAVLPHANTALTLCKKCGGFVFTMDGKQCSSCGHYL